MSVFSAAAARRFPSFFLSAFLSVLGIPFASCSDSGVDSDTARYVLGDGGDTARTLPDLQKAYIEAGIVGEGGNTVVSDFVNFSRVTEYGVDVLPDGRVRGVRDLHLKAVFGDSANADIRHSFYPLRSLQFHITELAAGEQGANAGRPVELEGDPDDQGGAGLKALFVHQGRSVTLVTKAGDALSRGHAYISGVNPAQRMIVLHLEADLTNPLPRTVPNRVVDRMVVRVDLQLPY